MLAPVKFNDVTRENLVATHQRCLQHVSSANFVAIDTEFTGLGQNTRSRNLDERYDAFRRLVQSHALLALGLSTFEATSPAGKAAGMRGTTEPEDDSCCRSGTASQRKMRENVRCRHDVEEDGSITKAKRQKVFVDPSETYTVNNYSFTLLQETEYVVNPRSMAFLAECGFDFQKQLTRGIPYMPGNWRPFEESANTDSGADGGKPRRRTERRPSRLSEESNAIMRVLFDRLSRCRVPLVVHNGLLDLVFLYHSFFADLPEKLGMFLADLSALFPAGIYDTKYVADFQTRERASFLAYLYRKYERENVSYALTENGTHLSFIIQDRWEVPANPPLQKTDCEMRNLGERKVDAAPENGKAKRPPYCTQYALHGYCSMNRKCGKSHDLDVILDDEERAEGRTRKKPHAGFDTCLLAPSRTNAYAGVDISSPNMLEPSVEERAGASAAVDNSTPNVLEPRVEKRAGEGLPTAVTAKGLPDATAGGPGSPPTSRVASTNLTTGQATTSAAPSPSDFHSAPFDAFMTGFIFASQLRDYTPAKARDFANKLYLIGRDVPLTIEKSRFSTFSRAVVDRLAGDVLQRPVSVTEAK